MKINEEDLKNFIKEVEKNYNNLKTQLSDSELGEVAGGANFLTRATATAMASVILLTASAKGREIAGNAKNETNITQKIKDTVKNVFSTKDSESTFDKIKKIVVPVTVIGVGVVAVGGVVIFSVTRMQNAKNPQQFMADLDQAIENTTTIEIFGALVQKTEEILRTCAPASSDFRELNQELKNLRDGIQRCTHLDFLQNKPQLATSLKNLSHNAIKNLKIRFDVQNPTEINRDVENFKTKVENERQQEEQQKRQKEEEDESLKARLRQAAELYYQYQERKIEFLRVFHNLQLETGTSQFMVRPETINKLFGIQFWSILDNYHLYGLHPYPEIKTFLEQVESKFYKKYSHFAQGLEYAAGIKNFYDDKIDYSKKFKEYWSSEHSLEEILNPVIIQKDFFTNFSAQNLENFQTTVEESIKIFGESIKQTNLELEKERIKKEEERVRREEQSKQRQADNIRAVKEAREQDKIFSEEKEKKRKEVEVDREAFIADFKQNLYETDWPYSKDNPPLGVVPENIKEDHKNIKIMIQKSPNPELAKNIYSELMWLERLHIILNKGKIEYSKFYSVQKIMDIVTQKHEFTEEEICNMYATNEKSEKKLTYEDFIQCATDTEYGKIYSNIFKSRFDDALECFDNLLADSYNAKDVKVFKDSILMLGNQLFKLKTSQSLTTKERALGVFQTINNNLEKLKSHIALKDIAAGIQEVVIPLIKKVTREIEDKKVQRETSQKINRVFDTSQRYVPYTKKEDVHQSPKIVGSGASGIVDVFYDTVESKKIAIKRFRRDAKISESQLLKLQKIDSPYVAKVLNLIDDGKGLVMEYVEGHEGLIRYIYNTKKNSREKILDIAIQLVKGFEAFEKAGLCHPDLSHTDNVIIDKHGNVKIIDYDDASASYGYRNLYDALSHVASVFYTSYDDIYENFLNEFPQLHFAKRSTDIRKYPAECVSDLSKTDNRPTFEQLIRTLEKMKTNS